jgi:hypothetical protein
MIQREDLDGLRAAIDAYEVDPCEGNMERVESAATLLIGNSQAPSCRAVWWLVATSPADFGLDFWQVAGAASYAFRASRESKNSEVTT